MIKKIFESTLIMGTSTVMVMAVDLVRVKIMAVLLGTAGVGTLAILNQFHTVAVSIICLGLGNGITRYIAKYESDGMQENSKRVLGNAFQAILLVSVVFSLLTILLSTFLSEWLLGDRGFFLFIIIYAVSLPFAAYPFATNHFLRGLKKVKELAKINFYRSFISIFLIIPLVYFFGLKGAVFSVIVTTTVHLLLNKYFVSKERNSFRKIPIQSFKPDIMRKLLPYGITSLITGFSYYLSLLFFRMIIVHNLGMEMNGIYQPVWALTMIYPTLVLSSMSAYAYPRLCELKTNHDISEELNGIFRVTVLLIVPVMLFLVVACKPIIVILYSPDFIKAAEYLPLQIVGDFFKIVVWSIGMFILPTKRLKAFVWLSLVPYGFMVGLAALLVKSFLLHGIVAAFTICYFVTFIAYLIYARRQINFKFWPKNYSLLVISFIALVCIILSSKYLAFDKNILVSILIACLWGFLSVTKDEIHQLKIYLSEKFFRFFAPSRS
jgi:O-antigen/teichoic acid export membrane protein